MSDTPKFTTMLDGPRTAPAASQINIIGESIMDKLHTVEGDHTMLVMYAGSQQRAVLSSIERGDQQRMVDDTFLNVPIVWVSRHSYLHIALR